jgi:hypothetical protein
MSYVLLLLVFVGLYIDCAAQHQLQLIDLYEIQQERPATESNSINVLPASLPSLTATWPTVLLLTSRP